MFIIKSATNKIVSYEIISYEGEFGHGYCKEYSFNSEDDIACFNSHEKANHVLHRIKNGLDYFYPQSEVENLYICEIEN